MDYNPITFVITLFLVTIVLTFYTLFALIVSHKITNFIIKNKKHTILAGIIYLAILILFLYVIKVFVLQKFVNQDNLFETAFIMVGPIISVFSVLYKDSHIKALIKTINDYMNKK